MLLHKGKLVNPQMSLASQGFIHNSSVFKVTKGIGGGKNNATSSLESGNTVTITNNTTYTVARIVSLVV